MTARERVDLAAVDLFASMGRPVASGLKAAGAQPEPPRAVYAGTPVLLFGEMESGVGEPMNLAWEGGSLSLDVPSGDAATGETVRLLRGSRLITDWESRYPGEAAAPLEKRRRDRVAARLVELSKTFGLASREMSLVAVVKRPGDRPGELPETRVVPVGMPQDTAFSAYFSAPAPASPQPAALRDFTRMFGAGGRGIRLMRSRRPVPAAEARMVTADDELIELAAMLEPDGGMPGDSLEARAARTIAAVLAFAAGGHTLTGGAFRLHVTRLVDFLKSLRVASEREARVVDRARHAASSGRVPEGQWLALARAPGTRWKDIDAALK